MGANGMPHQQQNPAQAELNNRLDTALEQIEAVSRQLCSVQVDPSAPPKPQLNSSLNQSMTAVNGLGQQFGSNFSQVNYVLFLNRWFPLQRSLFIKSIYTFIRYGVVYQKSLNFFLRPIIKN